VLPPYSGWRWRQQCPPKRRYPTTTLHVVTTEKTSTSIFTAVKTSCVWHVHFYLRHVFVWRILNELKVKLSLCLTNHHAMKMYWGSGGIVPRIFNIGTRWRWVASFTHQPLYPRGKSPLYPLHRRLGGPQNRSGYGGEEKNSHSPPGIEPRTP
jgi:hypothetical protein